jgi:hypothetical protein
MSADGFDYYNWGEGSATGTSWVETRVAAEQPTAHRITPHTRNGTTPSVHWAGICRS